MAGYEETELLPWALLLVSWHALDLFLCWNPEAGEQVQVIQKERSCAEDGPGG